MDIRESFLRKALREDDDEKPAAVRPPLIVAVRSVTLRTPPCPSVPFHASPCREPRSTNEKVSLSPRERRRLTTARAVPTPMLQSCVVVMSNVSQRATTARAAAGRRRSRCPSGRARGRGCGIRPRGSATRGGRARRAEPSTASAAARPSPPARDEDCGRRSVRTWDSSSCDDPRSCARRRCLAARRRSVSASRC